MAGSVKAVVDYNSSIVPYSPSLLNGSLVFRNSPGTVAPRRSPSMSGRTRSGPLAASRRCLLDNVLASAKTGGSCMSRYVRHLLAITTNERRRIDRKFSPEGILVARWRGAVVWQHLWRSNQAKSSDGSWL
jgi:hypothetical protein